MDPSGTAELASGTLAAGTRLAGYRVESVVGRGGMATVYRAVDEALQRTVALKVFSPAVADDPSLRSRFIREARLAASLDHEHVVPVHASGEADGRLFIAMRFVEGRDLATLIAAEAPLEPARTIALLDGVARALDAAHAHGMVHRDVKPGNILVAEPEGVEHAYLADFGITHERSGGTGLTRDGQFVGSVAYAAPEQILGGEVEARTDVYGLACVAFECLTGVQPYRRPSDVTLLFAHLNEPPPAVSAFRPELAPLDDVVAWGMAKAADARPSSARAFLRSLETRFGAISMVGAPGAGATAPADEVPSLPREATSFVGRDAEIAQIGALLAEARAVVLVGPGGVGKTRLAGRVARAHASSYPGGVLVVPLAAVSDPDLVLPAIAEQAGVRAIAGEPLEAALARRFRAGRTLLLLDNVEHLVAAAGAVAGLLDACRDLTVLSTGRRGFRLEGERELAVQPLPVPVSPGDDPQDLADQPAVRLFLDRARSSRTGFRPTEADLRTVAAICARLDGLPLAIELAAARIRLLGPTTMLARLDAPLGFLEGGPSTSDERHKTLRATIRWSDGLLDEDERRLFVTMACFTGGWTLDAVEAVSASAGMTPGSPPVIDLLERLLDHSLVTLLPGPDGEARYGYLDTIREYALEQLTEAGAREAVELAHARYFAEFSEVADRGLRGSGQQGWNARIASDSNNIRAATRWSLDHDQPALASRIAAAMWWYWDVHGDLAEGRRWIEEALEAETTPTGRSLLLNGLGCLLESQRDLEAAKAALTEALAIRRAQGDEAGIAVVLNNLGIAHRDAGEAEASEAAYLESLEIFERLGKTQRAATIVNNLGLLARDRGDFDEAARRYREGLEIDRRLGDDHGVSIDLNNLGLVALHAWDLEGAARQFGESLALKRSLGARAGIAEVLDGIAGIASRSGDPLRGGRLYGAASALRARVGTVLGATDLAQYRDYVAEARMQAEAGAFDDAWAAGARLEEDDAAEEAERWLGDRFPGAVP